MKNSSARIPESLLRVLCFPLCCLVLTADITFAESAEDTLLESYAPDCEKKYERLELVAQQATAENAALASLRIAELSVGERVVPLCESYLQHDPVGREAYHCLIARVGLSDPRTESWLRSWIATDPSNALPEYLYACREMRDGDLDEAMSHLTKANDMGAAYFRPLYLKLIEGGMAFQNQHLVQAEADFVDLTSPLRGELRAFSRSITSQLGSTDPNASGALFVELVKMGNTIARSKPLCVVHFLTGAAITEKALLDSDRKQSAPHLARNQRQLMLESLRDAVQYLRSVVLKHLKHSNHPSMKELTRALNEACARLPKMDLQ